MAFAVEVFGRHKFYHLVDHVVVKQDRAEHRLLGRDVLRGNARETLFRHNSHERKLP